MSNLFSQLQAHARQNPSKIALRQCVAGGATIDTTYADLAASGLAFAHLFREHNSARIIPLLLPKSATCVAAMFGALHAGKAFACLNRKLRPPQIREILRRIGPTVGIADGPGSSLLEELKTEPLPDSRWWIVPGDSFTAPNEEPNLRIGQQTPSLDPSPNSQPGCCLFTSGSTGTPKGVLISSADLDARAAAERQLFSLSADDILLNILPFSFDVGLNQLLSAIAAGCQLVLTDSWLPVDIMKTVASLRVTGISAVPAIWSDLLAAGLTLDSVSLRYITISGGDLPRSKLDHLPALARNIQIFKTYGQSETFRSTALLPSEFDTKRESVGRPFGDANVYVIRDDNSPCDPLEEGEILHTGLGTMTGYLDGDNREKLRPNPFLGPHDPSPLAVFTGDYGYLDEDGYLFLRGRRDAMVKIAGNRVYPREIVEQLTALPGVAEADVVAVETSDGQTRLVAFVVNSSPRSPAELRRDLSARLPSYMIPSRIVPLPALPRTPSGKPDRPALIEIAKM